MLSSPLPEEDRAEAWSVQDLDNEILITQVLIDNVKHTDWDQARTLISAKTGLRVALNLKLGKTWNDGFKAQGRRKEAA
jgi:hypothetical protein